MLRARISRRGFLGVSRWSANDQLVISKLTIYGELFLSFGPGVGPIMDATARDMRT
jgi:hypothetical protein